MQSSDILTILGLILAVWAIIPRKERRFILLFFSKFELGVLISSGIFIHYFLAFDWLAINWYPSLSTFTLDKGIPSKTWAYIITLITLVYPLVKVSFGYFSKSRLKDLIDLYETYLKEGEIDILITYIKKYHIADIKSFLRGMSHLPEKENFDVILRRPTEENHAYDRSIRSKRILFASRVYGAIIQNESFIEMAADKYPNIFATAFSGIETEKASNEDAVKLFIAIIFESKNKSFIRELKIMSDTDSSVLKMGDSFAIPILSSLFINTKAAAAHNIWYPVGESTLRSLKHDESQRDFLTRKYDHLLEPELWNQTVFVAKVYFNYMVRETIYRDSGWHMWLFYFSRFLELLIDIIPFKKNDNNNPSHHLFAHKIIEDLFMVMTDWLNLAMKEETDNRVIDTIRCLGGCIYAVCQADDSKISKEFKIEQMDRILRSYFIFSNYPDNIAANTARKWFEKLFLNPKGVDFGTSERTEEYLAILKEAWNKFDKVPYQGREENGSIGRFVTTVLKPIGLVNLR